MGFDLTKVAPQNVEWLGCFTHKDDLISFFIIDVDQILSLILVLQELPTSFPVVGAIILPSNPINTPHEAQLAAMNKDFASLPICKSEMLDDCVATTNRVEADKGVT